jgi:protoporphyrinogen oxidase
MNIAIIGAGYVGMSAAYDLAKAGHQVTVYESAPYAGGLAAGFKADHWEWALEKFYHHLFVSDKPIIDFLTEIGASHLLQTYRPSTDLVYKDEPYPFDSPQAVLTYPGLSFIEKIRAGMAVAYMKVNRNWRQFDTVTAHEWLGKVMGGAYTKEFQPLLRGKFNDAYYQSVPMTWFWARMFARTPNLIYPNGGFTAVTEAMQQAGEKQGVTYRLATPVRHMSRAEAGWTVEAEGEPEPYDKVLVTLAPHVMGRLAPELPADYIAGLQRLNHLGAVVITVALSHQLTKKSYWLNLNKQAFPMLCLVEHTNMVDKARYGGDHIVYMGDYLDPNHPYLSYSAERLFEVYEPALKRFNPYYQRDWVRGMWIHSTPYAQPIPTLNHAHHVPSLKTPLSGLYFASMSHVYPWDRGTNFAVEIGRKVANEIQQPAS